MLDKLKKHSKLIKFLSVLLLNYVYVKIHYEVSSSTASRAGYAYVPQILFTMISSVIFFNAFVGIIFGVFKDLTAGGNKDQAGAGKKVIKRSIILLLVTIGIYVVGSVILTLIEGDIINNRIRY